MKSLILPLLLLLDSALFAQSPIEVYKGTVKIEPVSEESVYFGFAKGDQVIIDFESIGRELKEFELLQYPKTSKFLEYEKTKIPGKKISISATGVYQFRLANRSATGRECKLHILRIPASTSTKKFNTRVEWKTLNDTIYSPSKEKYIERRDTSVINRDFEVTVNSQQEGGRQFAEFNLPENTISWGFYIGTNREGKQVFQEATQKFAQTNKQPAKLPGYNPVTALALNNNSYFTQLQKGDGIMYYIVDETNATLARQFQPFENFRSKKVINDFITMKKPVGGKYYFYLVNENGTRSVDVMLKISAIVVYEKWGERPAKTMHLGTKKIPYLKP